MAVHVKVCGKWKDVKINPNVYLGQDFSGFICMQELTDYSLYSDEGSGKIGLSKKKQKRNEPNKRKALSASSKTKKKMKRLNTIDLDDSTGETPMKKAKTKNKCQTPDIEVDESAEGTDEDERQVKITQRKLAKSVTKRQKLKRGKSHLVDEKQTYKKSDMTAWQGLFVPDPVLRALAEKGFTSPTPIQVLSLPPAIRDRMDIVGAAETGSGKTLAFGIPLIHRILELKKQAATQADELSTSSCHVTSDIDDLSDNSSCDEEAALYSDEEYPDQSDTSELEDESENKMVMGEGDSGDKAMINTASHKPLYALILTPTRELALQVKDHLVTAAKYADIKVITVVGGMASQKQTRLLRRCPEIVVATPGRLWELLHEGDPHLSKVNDISCLVIDEADRMVEKGHFQELSQLLEVVNSDEQKKESRQTFVFSATLTFVHQGPLRLKFKKRAVKMTERQKLEMLMAQIGVKSKPKIIDLTRSVGTAENLTEARINMTTEDKDVYLYYFLFNYPGRTLVFANSKDCIRRLVSVFKLLNCCPLSLHADMHQRQRLKNLDRFKGNPRGLLLATDVAARGLDIPDVQHVIHYQVPRTTENYVHRSGRTARASKEGLSVMFVGPDDLQYYRKIIKNLNRDEDLPLFPVKQDVFYRLQTSVNLARTIDKEEHRMNKKKHENQWYLKAAEEMDIDLDDDVLLYDLGDDWEQSQARGRLEHLKAQLKTQLHMPLQKAFSGKYPTKTGKLHQPMQICEDDAIGRMKEQACDKASNEKLDGERSLKKNKTKKRHRHHNKHKSCKQ